MLVGFPNRIMNQMCAELMLNQDFAKFVYYKGESGDILSLPDLENAHKLLKNKQVHINRKIPKILHDSDVNVFMNLNRWQSYKSYNGKGHSSQKIDEVTIKIVVLMQGTCVQTENGNRDVALVSIIKDILEDNLLSDSEDKINSRAIIFNNIESKKISAVSDNLKRLKVQRPLLATVTETSVNWDLKNLLYNLQEEAISLNSSKTSIHKNS